MKIATWNVNGIRARQEQVRSWLRDERPDVLCLQEIKAAPDQVPEALCAVEGYWCFWHGMKGYSGVALLISCAACPAAPQFQHPPFDVENRIVTAVVDGITVASVYVPNGGKDYPAKLRFLRALDAYAADLQATGDPLIICGDVNIARTELDVHPKERRSVIGQLPEERELFEQILAKGLVDVGRALDPQNDGLFTWWAPWRQMRQRNIGWRLDYVLASSALAARAKSCTVQREIGTSDHGPVVAVFG
jgi:exodeoxyribonuclease-3